jgi:hypothetical protein
MQYEFFFLKQRRQARPKILRAVASSLSQARLMVAQQYGFDPSQPSKKVKQYLESIRIHDAEPTNILITATGSRRQEQNIIRRSA